MGASVLSFGAYYWIFNQQWSEDEPAQLTAYLLISIFFSKLLTDIDVVAVYVSTSVCNAALFLYKIQLAIHCNIAFYLILISFIKHLL